MAVIQRQQQVSLQQVREPQPASTPVWCCHSSSRPTDDTLAKDADVDVPTSASWLSNETAKTCFTAQHATQHSNASARTTATGTHRIWAKCTIELVLMTGCQSPRLAAPPGRSTAPMLLIGAS